MSGARVVITGCGVITSVGRSAAAACAAIHANISRPRRVEHFKVLDAETQDLIALKGHPIKGYTEGFIHQGRWMRLARGCLMDLFSHAQLPGAAEASFWTQTGLLATTAYPDSGWFLEGTADGADGMAARLRDVLGLPIDDKHLLTLSLGHAGGAVAIERGMRELGEGRLQRVLVVAADSLLAPGVLEQLAAQRRLKQESQPVGLMPGEAGACLLLELESSARRRGAQAHALVAGVATAHEKNHRLSAGVNTGEGLAACIQQVLSLPLASAPFSGDIYSDLNGEEWRAREWGHARVRVGWKLADPEVHVPCTSVGDTGAASGVLGVSLAIHALARGFSRTGLALVLSSSERGHVGSICVHALEPRAQSPRSRSGRAEV